MSYFGEPADQLQRDDFFDAAAYGLASAAAGKRFESFVPANDASGIVFDHHSDIDRLDNVLAEVLQALIFACLLLEGAIQARILDRDSDVVGYRLQQFEVFAR